MFRRWFSVRRAALAALATVLAALIGPVRAADGVAYETKLKGVEQASVRSLLKKTSQLIALTEQPPPTVAGLRRRASDDRERLRKALRSEGFYDSKVDIRIKPDAEPVKVVIDVATGPIYVLGETEVVYTREIRPDVPVPRGIADLDGLTTGMDARAPRIVAAQRRILAKLRRNGFPEPSIADRRAVVNHDERTLSMTWRIDPGPYAVFGELRFAGLDTVEAAYVRQFRQWKPGEPYDQEKVAETRKAIMGTDLFSSAAIERPAITDGRQAVVFDMREREHRSVGFTARFATSEGPSGTAFWEHRNWFGRNETVRFTAEAGLIDQSLLGEFSKPRFLRENQTFNSALELRRQDSDAFTERALSLDAELERQFTGIWSGAVGGSLEITETEDNEGTRTFVLVGAPARLERDSRNDRLNPTDGSRVALRTTPYIVTVDETNGFLRNEVNASGYLGLDAADRVILAGRGRLGTILGPKTDLIPASKRFYAGGGGSLRGFDFQAVGPLDDENDPLGGRSVIEASVELRWQITDSIGVVPFVDAGNVYDSPMPGIQDDGEARLRVAGGLGFRYFTAIGPVRVDVARALDRREVDDAFELYISFGQAF